VKKKLWILCLAAVLYAIFSTVWVIVHRRLIRAAIRREAIPACPHWLPGCVLEKLAVTEPLSASEE
jgi:hypothetical protein